MDKDELLKRNTEKAFKELAKRQAEQRDKLKKDCFEQPTDPYAPRRYIPKDKLEHGAYYRGQCRAAKFARWDGRDNIFHYRRNKMGYAFIDTIKHPEDDDGLALFYPLERINVNEKDVITFK